MQPITTDRIGLQLTATLRWFWLLPRKIFMGFVRVYQLVISPWLPSTCRYTPTCSAYSIQAFQKYGVLKGLILTFYRIGRCHPFGGHGYDPPVWFGESDETPDPDD